ncbi:alpha-amylase family glycosyl hydrolase [Streptomyces sp. NPDC047108]|uniref:alpha-amylase family glycosyl hydrolase n=1 Tax=Streptomyces sp. NPDC047108 TaxID=3155025 RepID=UPI003405F8BC
MGYRGTRSSLTIKKEGVVGEWWRRAVIYQVYLRSFQDGDGDGVGDLPGLVRRLPYLADLGVNCLWISPFHPSPQKDFGYDVVDHRGVDPLYGSLRDIDHLLERAHALGLRVLMDLVPNHTSDQHPWFVDARASPGSRFRDWYIWRDPAPGGGPPTNWRAVTGGSAWIRDPGSSQYHLASFLPFQPDLNWRNPKVLEAPTSPSARPVGRCRWGPGHGAVAPCRGRWVVFEHRGGAGRRLRSMPEAAAVRACAATGSCSASACSRGDFRMLDWRQAFSQRVPEGRLRPGRARQVPGPSPACAADAALATSLPDRCSALRRRRETKPLPSRRYESGGFAGTLPGHRPSLRVRPRPRPLYYGDELGLTDTPLHAHRPLDPWNHNRGESRARAGHCSPPTEGRIPRTPKRTWRRSRRGSWR